MNSMLPYDTLDLRGMGYPINSRKSELKIAEMISGELLEILLDEGEPGKKVVQSLAAEGHDIAGVEKLGDGSLVVFVRKV